MAPDKIYIAETPNKLIEIWSEEPIESKPYITEHEYIRKDAILNKLKTQRDKCVYRSTYWDFWQAVINQINEI